MQRASAATPKVKDLGRLSFLKRAQITALNSSVRSMYPPARHFLSGASSGSTGMPAEFLFDRHRVRGRYAARIRYLRAHGWNPFQRTVWHQASRDPDEHCADFVRTSHPARLHGPVVRPRRASRAGNRGRSALSLPLPFESRGYASGSGETAVKSCARCDWSSRWQRRLTTRCASAPGRRSAWRSPTTTEPPKPSSRGNAPAQATM